MKPATWKHMTRHLQADQWPALRRLVCLSLWGLLMWCGQADSEPYLAVRGGYKCSQCHTNITGGGKRNPFGHIYTQTTFPHTIVSSSTLNKTFKATLPQPAEAEYGTFVSTTLARFLSFGGGFRAENQTTFSAGSLETRNAFALTEANLYLEARLVPEVLSFYIDETLGPGAASSREFFGLLRLPRWWDFYIKGGKFLLPFGWRLQDDEAFVRNRTGINYDNPDIGIEFGIEPGPLTLSLSLTNGTAGGAEDNLFKQITGRTEAVFRHWRVGWSFSYNTTEAARRIMYGPLAGLTFGRFTLLAEADLIEDRDNASGEKTTQLAVYSALNFLIVRGINLKLSYEFLDPDIDLDNNARTRWVVGIEPVLTQFLQVRLFYRLNDSIPQNPAEGADEIRLEMHVFF